MRVLYINIRKEASVKKNNDGISKGVTLIELILSIVFLGVIILAAVSFDYTSFYLFDSSRKKAAIVNERSLCLEHIAKYASRATGDINNSGIVVDAANKWAKIRIDKNNPHTPSDYSDDKWVRYEYKNKGGNVYELDFCSDWDNGPPSGCNVTEDAITSKIVTDGTNPTPGFYKGTYVNEVVCSPFTLRYKPGNSNPMDVRKNPEVYMYDNVLFSSVSHSIN